MLSPFPRVLPYLALFLSFAALHAADVPAKLALIVKPDHDTGVYAPGEKVTWSVDVDPKVDRASLTPLTWRVRKDVAGEATTGMIDLAAGPATITASRDDPGALLAEIYPSDNFNVIPLAMGGAVISPEKIGPSVPAPADFDAFWAEKLKELDAVPINPVLEPVDVAGLKNSEGVECFKVTLDNIRGTHAKGLLAKPTQGDKFPAMLMVNAAGVGPLDKAAVVGQARPGWLALNISAHDLPVDESPEFYKNLKEGALKNYFSQGNEDREQSYFLRMFMGCVRGAEYLASRPDWDGKTLIVTGTSQGGLQSFATAALYPKISAMMVNVPSGCDNLAPLANPPRAFGWPYWLSKVGPPGRDLAKIQATAPYFDGLNFASGVKCPALVDVGLIDIASRPAGVIAAYNAIPGPKQLIIMPTSDHYGSGGVQLIFFQTFFKWKDALQKGNPLPLPATAPK